MKQQEKLCLEAFRLSDRNSSQQKPPKRPRRVEPQWVVPVWLDGRWDGAKAPFGRWKPTGLECGWQEFLTPKTNKATSKKETPAGCSASG